MRQHLFSGFFALAMSAFVYRSNHALEIEYLKLKSNQVFQPFRVVHLSDLHIPYSGFRLSRLLLEIKQCQPDLIFLTGDLLDRSIREVEVERAHLFLKELSSLAKVVYCYGNHEINLKSTVKQFNEWMIILENETMNVDIKGNRLNLIGLDPQSPSVMKTEPTMLNLILDHYPNRFLCSSGIQFSGHVHGGQFIIKGQGLVAPDQGIMPKYFKGFYRLDQQRSLIVSAGLGASQIPLRFNNPNHLIVVDFSK